MTSARHLTRWLVRRTGYVLASLIVLSACTETDICATANAPRDRAAAVVFARYVGAVSNLNSQVSIVRGWSRTPWGQANLFVATMGHAHVAMKESCGPVVLAAWRGNAVLEVLYDANAKIIRREPSAEGVRVRYRPMRLPPFPTDSLSAEQTLRIPGFEPVQIVPSGI